MILPTKICGDARAVLPALPENHFHTCITSIPYWGLRSYLPKGHPMKSLEIGTEPTFDLFLEHIVEVFDQVRRVLREDGTLWLNVGDAYSNSTKWGRHSGGKNYTSSSGGYKGQRIKRPNEESLKPKDLWMMPSRVAMALQASGWYLRSMIPWVKRNAMPESVTDRPATAVEYVFLLSKSERYFYDRHAVMMESSDNTHSRTGRDGSFKGNAAVDETIRGVNPKTNGAEKGNKQNASFAAGCSQYIVGQRNRRNSDWFTESWQGMLTDEQGDPLALIVNPKGTSIAHFAAYPPKLIIPMVKAGTSEAGCCAECGAPRLRTTAPRGENSMLRDGKVMQHSTTGWKPSCDCGADAEPCRVLDPFSGISTTLMVARDLGRHSTGVDINEEYQRLAEPRDAQAVML